MKNNFEGGRNLENYAATIRQRIGNLIRGKRRKIQLSQAQLAQDICSQALISSLEKGEYLPNTAVLIQLCQRLQVSLDQNFLNTKLPFQEAALASKVFTLCKERRYREMLQFLDRPATMISLTAASDFQIYYYYYACATYQAIHNLATSQRYLKMALSYTKLTSQAIPQTEIEILIVNALATIKAQLEESKRSQVLFKKSQTGLEKLADPAENLNVINYYYGIFLMNLGDFLAAQRTLITGFDQVVRGESYFMLADYALSLVDCYQHLGRLDQAAQYQQRYEVFHNL
ncbi:helix-turn-helix transcriptional regulator [Lactobacillus sp. DCY120]|uniref:Helix-turn-helix transcriptional regulator n=1 Tax=Bombilactobacillus apium TaxID=2675299 RepID=A0A850R1F9_9LACO|nr:helix-turn-helix transcriptional regulator [Bombilactobacillus apium]NVY96939.1 helix-turn-helix transcriptional regulator [Bombilactobacillus apium]